MHYTQFQILVTEFRFFFFFFFSVNSIFFCSSGQTPSDWLWVCVCLGDIVVFITFSLSLSIFKKRWTDWTDAAHTHWRRWWFAEVIWGASASTSSSVDASLRWHTAWLENWLPYSTVSSTVWCSGAQIIEVFDYLNWKFVSFPLFLTALIANVASASGDGGGGDGWANRNKASFACCSVHCLPCKLWTHLHCSHTYSLTHFTWTLSIIISDDDSVWSLSLFLFQLSFSPKFVNSETNVWAMMMMWANWGNEEEEKRRRMCQYLGDILGDNLR